MPLIECKPIKLPRYAGAVPLEFVALARREFRTSMMRLLIELQDYPAYKYISWKSLGGFISDKQRRFVMANIRKGIIKIPRPRTGALRQSWKMRIDDSENNSLATIRSGLSTARYVQDAGDQSRRHKRMGWKTVDYVANTVWPKERKRIQTVMDKFASRGEIT